MAERQETSFFVIRDNYGTTFADTLQNAPARRVVSGYSMGIYGYADEETGKTEQREVVIDAYIRSPLLQTDEYYALNQLFLSLYHARYAVIIAGVVMLIASFALFVFLMCSAGHKPGRKSAC